MKDEKFAKRLASTLFGPRWNIRLREECGWEEKKIKAFWIRKEVSYWPEEFDNENLLWSIYDLFWYPLCIIRDEVAPEAKIIIESSTSGGTPFLVYQDDRILYKGWEKAWNFCFESELAFNEWCDEVAETIKK